MLCARPVQLLGRKRPVSCGKCINCRINRQSFWTGRILVEAAHSCGAAFATMTYDESHVPQVWNGLEMELTLDPDDVRKWLMRYRKAYGAVRFFLVGEYGDRTQRPHYHAVLFGVDPLEAERRVQLTWSLDGQPLGHTSVSDLNTARCRYVAQYTVKKLGKHHGALGARYPEFARMSRRPPLGAAFYAQLREKMLSRQGAAAMAARDGLVPSVFRFENRKYPIGLYWRNWLSEETGYAKSPEVEEDLPEDWEEQCERATAAAAKFERRQREKTAV